MTTKDFKLSDGSTWTVEVYSYHADRESEDMELEDYVIRTDAGIGIFAKTKSKLAIMQLYRALMEDGQAEWLETAEEMVREAMLAECRKDREADDAAARESWHESKNDI